MDAALPLNPSALETRLTTWMGRVLSRFFKEYVDRLELNGGERALELGPSAGNSTRHLARRLLPNGWVTAVDISPRWIEVAARQLRGLPNVTLIAGDIRRLGLANGSQDVAFINFVIHDIPTGERTSTLQAVIDTLVPGGRLFVREPLRFIDRGEIAARLQSCGLAEVSARVYAVKTQGPVFEGVYRKI